MGQTNKMLHSDQYWQCGSVHQEHIPTKRASSSVNLLCSVRYAVMCWALHNAMHIYVRITHNTYSVSHIIRNIQYAQFCCRPPESHNSLKHKEDTGASPFPKAEMNECGAEKSRLKLWQLGVFLHLERSTSSYCWRVKNWNRNCFPSFSALFYLVFLSLLFSFF